MRCNVGPEVEFLTLGIKYNEELPGEQMSVPVHQSMLLIQTYRLTFSSSSSVLSSLF